MAEQHDYIDFENDAEKVNDTCLVTATIIELGTGDSADIALDPSGDRVNNVPIHYHCDGANSVDGGVAAFEPDMPVLCLKFNSRGCTRVTPEYIIVSPKNGLIPCRYPSFLLFYGSSRREITVTLDGDKIPFEKGRDISIGSNYVVTENIGEIVAEQVFDNGNSQKIIGLFPTNNDGTNPLYNGTHAISNNGARGLIVDMSKKFFRHDYTVREVVGVSTSQIYDDRQIVDIKKNLRSPVDIPDVSEVGIFDDTSIPFPRIQTKVLDHITVTAAQSGEVGKALAQKWSIYATINGVQAKINNNDFAGENNYYIVRGIYVNECRYNFDLWKGGNEYYISVCGESVETSLSIYKLVDDDHFDLYKTRASQYAPGSDPNQNTRCLLSKDLRYWYYPGRDLSYAIEDTENAISRISVNGFLLYLDINPVTREVFSVTEQSPTGGYLEFFYTPTPVEALLYANPQNVANYNPVSFSKISQIGDYEFPSSLHGEWKSRTMWQNYLMSYYIPAAPPEMYSYWKSSFKESRYVSRTEYNFFFIGSLAIYRGQFIQAERYIFIYKTFYNSGQESTSSTSTLTARPCNYINRTEIIFQKAIPVVDGNFASTYIKRDYPNDDFSCETPPAPGAWGTNYTLDAAIAQESGWKLVCLGSKDKNNNAIPPFIVYNSGLTKGIAFSDAIGDRVFATMLNIPKNLTA